MEVLHFKTAVKKILSDRTTPVGAYLKLRDEFSCPVLLESNDFQWAENCFSVIGLEPLATYAIWGNTEQMTFPNGEEIETELTQPLEVPNRMMDFFNLFQVKAPEGLPFLNGFFGYNSFESVRFFDTFQFDPAKKKLEVPDIYYVFFRYILTFDHYKDELYLVENLLPGESSTLPHLEELLDGPEANIYPFQLQGKESSNLTDEEFMDLVDKGKYHCRRGDVFQVVFSRQFQQPFAGDEFNVYRILRSVNPSPYLFYFDFGNFRLFGSSPESQLVIQDNMASIRPIAGTYPRTGDDTDDFRQAKALSEDPKENAEHIMLVDLARNDLGKHCSKVHVKELKEVQYFSHVIHLVSNVEGQMNPGTLPFQVFADTFPAGTLSGAPKYKAIELIGKYENQQRSFYGGSIGYYDLKGNMNQAIIIRSFMSERNRLYYQAGAGIVAASVAEKELKEVKNKLGALKQAMIRAEKK